ncbi:MAG: RraA family protein [Chloroflexota bacterium]|nr:RraA family protein [Chloroflexota bacterium]MDE2856077.1 RraA family protein [Chloroflexota bacterium]MDE2947144.1 RraA family protein [Chloroflexota bacterium]
MTSVNWNDDEGLFELIRRELFTAVVGDIMDKLGFTHQFLPPRIRPLRPDMVVLGRAMTVLEADVFEERSASGNNPVMAQAFGLMFAALDDLKRNEVYICAGGSPRYALWGELMSTRALKLGAAGAVVDGYLRDTKGILALNFPAFAHGAYAQDQGARGKVIDFRVPLEIEGLRIQPGDIIFGDVDGVLVVPREAEEDIFRGAIDKARGEKLVGKAIEAGMSASEAFKKFGIM